MKAPDFAYARPTSLAEVFALLDQHGDDARLLAGGQSLIPTLNMRLSSPALLIDLGAIAGLDGIDERDGVVRIGAMVRHAALAASPVVRKALPLLAKAIPHIAHPAIRNRGTIGGSIALADPAAELPACVLALDATIVATGPSGERRIAARDFFRGLFATALAPAEVLTAIEIPAPPAGAVTGFGELARRLGDYAMVGLAAQGVRSGGRWQALSLAFFGAGDRPLLATRTAGRIVAGEAPEAAAEELAHELDPPADLNGPASLKRHLARVLLGRVLADMS